MSVRGGKSAKTTTTITMNSPWHIMIHLNAILLTINSCYPSGPDKSQLAMETDKSSSFLIIIITVCFRWWAGCVDTEGKVSGSLHKHPTWKLCMPVPSGATGLRQPRFWLRGLLPGHGDNNNSNVSDWITNSRLLTRIGASLSKSKKKKKKSVCMQSLTAHHDEK